MRRRAFLVLLGALGVVLVARKAFTMTLPAPANLHVTATTTTSIAIAWDAVPGAATYEVWKNGHMLSRQPGTTFTDTALFPRTSIVYSVAGVDSANVVGSFAVTFGTTQTDVTPPSVPTGLAATQLAGGVGLTWNPSTDDVTVDHYEIFRTASGTFTSIGVSKTTSFTDTSPVLGTQNQYSVRAWDEMSNVSNTSAPVVIVPTGGGDTTAPTVPANVTGTGGQAATRAAITITWTASTDNVAVDHYRVNRNGTTLTTTAATSITDSTPPTGALSYTVSAVDAAGNESAQSPPFTFPPA